MVFRDSGGSQAHGVAECGVCLELLALLPLPTECWAYRETLHHQAVHVLNG